MAIPWLHDIWIPLLVTGVPLLAGWTAGRIGSKVMHRLTLLASLGLAIAAGALLFGERVAGVPLATAVAASVIPACLLVLLPVGVFVELGYRFHSLLALAAAWLLFALPLLYLGILVLLVASLDLSCAPGESCLG
jgi:hypothetical protein